MTQIEVGPRGEHLEGYDTNQTTTANHHEAGSTLYSSALRGRRDASRRSEPLACGCRDPWTCMCFDGEPTEKAVDGYAAAVDHLNSCGLAAAPNIAAMRVMWRRGGDDRQLVRDIASRWGVSA